MLHSLSNRYRQILPLPSCLLIPAHRLEKTDVSAGITPRIALQRCNYC
ncbi:MAG: hypothetical protein K1Y36_26720 [Blastocatellia bacterium]|nr:hypothetical protein [Blastocatellia bacterium]